MSNFKKGELQFARAFLNENFSRIIDWAVGDIKRCCRMRPNGTCEDNGALVGAFILWCCALDYFAGLFTNKPDVGETGDRIKIFLKKYMPQYDPAKIIDLRWSLLHYYTTKHFVLCHENNLEENRKRHLADSPKHGIWLHLGCAVQDLENAIAKYYSDLQHNDRLKINAWRYYKKQSPIMPITIEVEEFYPKNMLVENLLNPITASGTTNEQEWIKHLQKNNTNF